MKKLILITLSIVLLVSMAGCAKKAEVSDAAKLLAQLTERPEFTFGELETFDLDNDGLEDRYVFVFETEEVAEDLFLDRSLEFDKTDSGSFDGKITLEFEYRGDKPIEYSHIEDIPKAFAESVDDLEFSVPPDEIIDPDPKVMFKRDFQEIARKPYSKVSFIIRATGPFGAFLELELPRDRFVMSVFDTCVNRCDKLSGVDRSLSFLNLAQFSTTELIPACGSDKAKEYIRDRMLAVSNTIEEEYIKGASRVILKGPMTECSGLRYELDRDLCKALVIETRCGYSEDAAQREKCINWNAISYKCLFACLLLTDEDQENDCLACVTGDKKYCEKIKNEELRKKCLEALGEAPEEEKKKEEEEEEWPFTDEVCAGFKSTFQNVLPGFELASSCGRYGASFTGERYYNTYLDLDGRNVPQEYRCQVMLDITGLGAAYAREHLEARRDNICGPEQEAEIKAVYGEGGYIMRHGDNDFLVYYPVPSLSGVYRDGRQASRNTPVGYCTELMLLHGNYTIEVHCLLAPSEEASFDMADSVLETAKSWLDEKVTK